MNQGVGGKRLPGRPAVTEVLPVDAYVLRRRDSRAIVRLSRAGWKALLAYDRTIPTGVVIGKRWRRSDAEGLWVGRYLRNIRGNPEIVFFRFRPR